MYRDPRAEHAIATRQPPVSAPVEREELDAAIERALREHAAWHAAATPSAPPAQPRVMVNGHMRRPFKRRDRYGVSRWAVRLYGIGFITKPHVTNGLLCFEVTYV